MKVGVAPTLYMGSRLPFTDHVYDDPDHPERVTRTVSSPLYSMEDHALIAAYQQYEDTLCPGCRLPRHEAWHSEMDGWYEADEFVCHSCTARAEHDVTYSVVTNTRPASKGPLPEFIPEPVEKSPEKAA